MRHMQPPPDAVAIPPGKPFRKRIATWNEWIGGAVSARNRAYLVALAAVGVAGLAVWDARVQRERRQFQVLIVERDGLGNVQRAADAREPRELGRYDLAKRYESWVHNARSVFVDANALRYALTNAYASTKAGSEAYRRLQAHHRENDPMERAGRASTYVYRQTALPLSNNTWQVEWCERTVSREGIALSVEAYRMTATHAIDKPRDAPSAKANPDGWYVVAFDWHRVEDGRETVRSAAAAGRQSGGGAPVPLGPEQCR